MNCGIIHSYVYSLMHSSVFHNWYWKWSNAELPDEIVSNMQGSSWAQEIQLKTREELLEGLLMIVYAKTTTPTTLQTINFIYFPGDNCNSWWCC